MGIVVHNSFFQSSWYAGVVVGFTAGVRARLAGSGLLGCTGAGLVPARSAARSWAAGGVSVAAGCVSAGRGLAAVVWSVAGTVGKASVAGVGAGLLGAGCARTVVAGGSGGRRYGGRYCNRIYLGSGCAGRTGVRVAGS